MKHFDFYGIKLANTKASFDIGMIHQLYQVIEFLKPKPTPQKLVRVGGDSDGAYLIPNDLDDVAACFSPGVNNFKNFEDELFNVYGIRSHMCDQSSDIDKFHTPLITTQQTFRKKWLDIETTVDSITISDWVDECEPGSGDLILQIDIEGSEYRNLLQAPIRTLERFRIIVIELHGLPKLNDPTIFSEVFYPFFRKLDELFQVIHAHPNNWSNRLYELQGTGFRVPWLLELTLLRRDRFSLHASCQYYAPQLPHPLDIAANVPDSPPLFLDENWMHGFRHPDAIKRMNEIQKSANNTVKKNYN